jgi:hypothetical protein
MMVEVKLSPFTPLIDRVFAPTVENPGPYQKTFGGGPLLMGEIELDYQVFQKVGSLAFGLSVGYGEKFGRSVDAVTKVEVGQSTGLRLLPLKALLVYRFDLLALKYNIPIVPYVKGAFIAVPWWVENGATVEVVQGIRGAGVKYGVGGVAGASVLLDVFDARLSRDFDTGTGVNHSYLFAEFSYQEMTVFDTTARPLDLSSRHWMFGLGFEF